MSYILDALKKSEQQRQAVEPNSVSDRLLVNQAGSKPKFRVWWLVLILVNISAIIGLFWYSSQNKIPTAPAVAGKQRQAANPVPTSAPATSSMPVGGEGPIAAPSESQQPDLDSPSIAEMIATEQPTVPPVVANKPAQQRQAKTVVEKKQVAAKKRAGSNYLDERRIQPEYEGQIADQAEPAPRSYPVQQEEAASYEPTQSRPKLAINVYGYAQKPEDRFVIINMTKYKVGQKINDGPELKAIHPDHIELRQGNVSFKMPRP